MSRYPVNLDLRVCTAKYVVDDLTVLVVLK